MKNNHPPLVTYNQKPHWPKQMQTTCFIITKKCRQGPCSRLLRQQKWGGEVGRERKEKKIFRIGFEEALIHLERYWLNSHHHVWWGHVMSLLAGPTKGFSLSQKSCGHLHPTAPCISHRHCDTQGQINTKLQCCLTPLHGKQNLRAHLEMEFLFCSGP